VASGGVAYPYKISCSQFFITGSGLPILSNKILKYATSLDEKQIYAGELIVNPLWKWIDFYLYDEREDGELVPLDNETVAVFTSGEDRFFLDLIDQHITVRADEYGEPYSLPITTQAALYHGNTPLTYADFVAKTAEKSLVLYPGSGGDIFTPMLGGFYPTRSVMWNISGGTIDQNGIITINKLPEDRAEIEVSALYDDVEYTATLTLIKVKDGEAPAVIDIENENASISCDAYGTPLPGELPFSTKAFFYKGTQKVTPFWSLSPPAGGVSIAQDGTITVAANAALGRTNNFLVNAAYRGKTYSRMFTLAKALEGFAATQYELLPGDRHIKRDAEGNNTPAALSCGQHKIVGNNPPVPSDKTIKYTTSASSVETVYSGPVEVGDLDWIKFFLYDGDNYLDSETVRVVQDGAPGVPGDSLYTWIKYADTAQGGGLSDSPAGKEYIGLAFNKATATESSNPADYVWSLIKGEPGIPGGSLYTWIKYADVADGTGMYQQPKASTKYIGIAVNQTTETESDNKADYVWSLFKGADSIYVDIENETVTLRCDAYGVPYPGALPIITKADLLDGGSPANASWSIASPPSGVSISSDGTITVAADAALGYLNRLQVKAVYNGTSYTRVFTVVKTLDGENPIMLTILPDTASIQCNHLGNPLRGLPFTAKATLYKGAREVTAAMELEAAARTEIIIDPGSGGDIFTPMLGGFYPTLGYPVV
jgi:hypothetical protein